MTYPEIYGINIIHGRVSGGNLSNLWAEYFFFMLSLEPQSQTEDELDLAVRDMVDILTFNLDLYHFSYQSIGISTVAGVIYGFADPASATTTLTSSSTNQVIYIGGYFHCWSLFDQIGLAQKEIDVFSSFGMYNKYILSLYSMIYTIIEISSHTPYPHVS